MCDKREGFNLFIQIVHALAFGSAHQHAEQRSSDGHGEHQRLTKGVFAGLHFERLIPAP
jgi:hypothetical protein